GDVRHLPGAEAAPRVRVGPAHVPRTAPRAHGNEGRDHAAARSAAGAPTRPRRGAARDLRRDLPRARVFARHLGLNGASTAVAARNVLGTELEPCSYDPLTGFTRNGCCDSFAGDAGVHLVCAEMTEEFLAFSKEAGNDLSTPRPEFGFDGLKPGDRWCLC